MGEFIAQHGHLLLLAPLAGALLNGLAGRRLLRLGGERLVGLIGCGAVGAAFLLALAAFAAVRESGEPIVAHGYTWLEAGSLRVDASLLFDPLSATMLLVVTGVGLLIHIYSTSYMAGDAGFPRYFASLNLFVFAMLLLVLAENALLMFVGWEGVGFCSYLLIGFWFTDRGNARAASKAFIVNRVGDLGFLVGLFLLFWLVRDTGDAGGTNLLSFAHLQARAPLLQGATLFGVSAVTVVCAALFIGAAGKSAQIPLHVWLPDAMAGPTPASALIHAATMVTAGVYMVARLHFLFALSPPALALVAVTGAATALLAASIACVQNDIKKVLAYSTISQLGFMFMAAGVAAHAAGIFHLVTHAFFKACLFLGAGSVILGTHHEQDIRRLGGLRRAMPITFLTFAVAAAALAGFPPLSGFFSKDEILWLAYSGEHGHPVLGIVGLATAGLTAFYMTRLVILTFFGARRGATAGEGHDHGPEKVRESPRAMTVPLLALAALAAGGGLLGIPGTLGGGNALGVFLEGVLGPPHAVAGHGVLAYLIMGSSVAVAAAGAGTAVLLYAARPGLAAVLRVRLERLHRLLSAGYGVDGLYDLVFVRGTLRLCRIPTFLDRYVIDLLVHLGALAVRGQARATGWFDAQVVDRAVDLIAAAVHGAGDAARRIQTGRVQAYVLTFLLFLAAAVTYAALNFGGGSP